MHPSYLVMPRADASHWGNAAYRERLYSLVDRGICGVAVFLGSLADTAGMIADLQERAKEPLLIAADYEYGLPMRLDGGVAFPRAMALGKGTTHSTEDVAAAIAEECVALGVQWNFAPVCDVNSNPQNPIINTRSFGEVAGSVAEHVEAFVRGTQRMRVMACAKHAPGHGDTATDSHLTLPTITVDAVTAAEREFIPFQAAIRADVRSIMVAHLCVPFLDPDLPASLSPAVVTGLVRETWGYQGLIVTDALDMQAITSTYTSADAAVRAVLAGNDVLLLPEDPHAAIDALERAVAEGTISTDRLTASVQRIMACKQWCGLFDATTTVQMVDQNAHAALALRAADAAIDIVGEPSYLPLTIYDHLAAYAVIDEADADTATTWFHYMAQAMEVNMDVAFIDGSMTDSEIEDMLKGTTEASAVLFAFFGKAVAYRGGFAEIERVPEIMQRLANGRPIIVVACGSPYGIKDLPSSVTLYTFSDTVPSLAASVLRLSGKTVS